MFFVAGVYRLLFLQFPNLAIKTPIETLFFLAFTCRSVSLSAYYRRITRGQISYQCIELPFPCGTFVCASLVCFSASHLICLFSLPVLIVLLAVIRTSIFLLTCRVGHMSRPWCYSCSCSTSVHWNFLLSSRVARALLLIDCARLPLYVPSVSVWQPGGLALLSSRRWLFVSNSRVLQAFSLCVLEWIERPSWRRLSIALLEIDRMVPSVAVSTSFVCHTGTLPSFDIFPFVV